MTRTRATAKQAGAKFERLIADHLAMVIDDRIDRRVKTGANDRGDLTGWRHNGMRIVAELKDYGGRILAGPWLNEAEVERRNDDAHIGLVIVKRRGTTKPGDQIVLMTLDNLTRLLGHDTEEPC